MGPEGAGESGFSPSPSRTSRTSRNCQPVREEDAVEVVYFVLEDDRRIAVHGIADLRQSPWVGVADDHLLRALNVTGDLGNGETAFRGYECWDTLRTDIRACHSALRPLPDG